MAPLNTPVSPRSVTPRSISPPESGDRHLSVKRRGIIGLGCLFGVGILLAGGGTAVSTSAKKKPRPSCGQALPVGDQTVPLTVDGRSRPFLLHVPSGYSPNRRSPLLLNLHPTGGTGLSQMDGTAIRATAEAGNFLVAAPTGGAISGAGSTWVVPDVPPRGTAPPGGFPDDVRYIEEVVNKVQSIACQDHGKVFSVGYSGGARMTSALGCHLADRFTAVIADAGLRSGAPASGGADPDLSTCKPARPIPVVALHGTADGTNPYDGGGTADWQYSVPKALEAWAGLNGCNPAQVVSTLGGTLDALSYAGCRGYSTALLYRVTGGGHDWFTSPVSTNAVIAETIAKYSLQKPQPKLKGVPKGCVSGRFRLRVNVDDDSPTARILATLDGKRVLSRRNKASGSGKVRVGDGGHRLLVTATDRAGLTGVKSRRLRGCG